MISIRSSIAGLCAVIGISAALAGPAMAGPTTTPTGPIRGGGPIPMGISTTPTGPVRGGGLIPMGVGTSPSGPVRGPR